MKEGRNKRRRAGAILAALCIAFSGGGSMINAFAGESVGSAYVQHYDNTSITDDLGELDVLQYPPNPFGKHEVIQFSEFCYSSKTIQKDDYGLYFYIYNPTEVPIYPEGNVALMATSYNADGTPAEYSNVELVVLDATSNNRFFKFKVKNSGDFWDMASAYAKANGGKRRYDIAGLQLKHTEGDYQMDRAFEKTYYCTGYAKGYGGSSTDESTLTVAVDSLETIELEVNHTYYRTGDYLNYVCDELNTVYFAVPNSVFEKYGDKLQKIKAEWYEYKTTPIFVTEDEEAYEEMQGMIGFDLSDYENMSDEDFMWRVLWEERGPAQSGSTWTWGKAYNPYADGASGYNRYNPYDWSDATPIPSINYLLYKNDPDQDEDFSTTSKEIEEYMLWYTEKFGATQGYIKGGKVQYAKGLFSAGGIDEHRLHLLKDKTAENGYIEQEIDAGDTGEMLFNKNQNWWDEFWGKKPDTTAKSYDPIVQVKQDDYRGLTTERFGEKFYVNQHDCADVLKFFNDSIANDCTPILFRFAQTDYYASKARFDEEPNDSFFFDNLSSVDGYVAIETAFLGFDIISLTFKDDMEVEMVIPVVADPIDIINGTDAPPGTVSKGGCENPFDSLLDILEFVILIVVLIIAFKGLQFVWEFFKWLFKG